MKGKVKSIRDFDAKIEKKENSILCLGHKQTKGYTKRKMLQERRKTENEYNAAHFKLKPSKMHRGELPTFFETQKEWWKLK